MQSLRKRTYSTLLLLIGAGACLLVTAYLIIASGSNVYYLVFHRPLSLRPASASAAHYTPPTLPGFQVSPSISTRTVARGDTQTMTIVLTPKQDTTGFLEVWIMSPQHREVFKSPMGENKPTTFKAGVTQTVSYSYTVPANAVSGTYRVSVIITSANQQTDYYVSNDFALFIVQ